MSYCGIRCPYWRGCACMRGSKRYIGTLYFLLSLAMNLKKNNLSIKKKSPVLLNLWIELRRWVKNTGMKTHSKLLCGWAAPISGPWEIVCDQIGVWNQEKLGIQWKPKKWTYQEEIARYQKWAVVWMAKGQCGKYNFHVYLFVWQPSHYLKLQVDRCLLSKRFHLSFTHQKTTCIIPEATWGMVRHSFFKWLKE